ncbi:MAG TPA: oxygen-independent coproporphyrinogen III oxidase-like protein, partial [Burkholderiaceae bacterium]|nr:oxygen-independent coproporphyrinogen III oxidase-like protein [Burkholderiaceae bacterium]
MIPIKPVANNTGNAPRAVTPAEAATAFLKPGVITLAALPPLSLYVHIPWCVKKCPYCD